MIYLLLQVEKIPPRNRSIDVGRKQTASVDAARAPNKRRHSSVRASVNSLQLPKPMHQNSLKHSQRTESREKRIALSYELVR